MRAKNHKFLAVIALMAAGLASTGASAVPITGEVGFGGIWAPTGGTGIDDATGLQINLGIVLAGSGDFSGSAGSSVTFTPFDFDVFSPVSPLWTYDSGGTTYSFVLNTITVDFQDSNELNLSGTGVLSATGFDDTAGSWNFTGQSNVLFTFSSNSAAIPEPTALLLFGLGFAGFIVARRRRR